MANPIPLIRALSLVPALRWLMTTGRPIDELLKRHGLSAAPFENPMRPIPLISVGKFLREVGDLYGADAPCRIVSEADIMEIALLGKVAIGTKTPREALTRIMMVIPLFCSHEHLTLEQEDQNTVIRQFYTQTFSSTTQHLFHQYVAAMLDRLIAMTGAQYPRIANIEMMPHPNLGFDHVQHRFGEYLTGSDSRTITMVVGNEYLDRQFRAIGRDRMKTTDQPVLVPIRGDGTLCNSLQILLLSLLHDGEVPKIRQVAAAADRSVRTLQRQLEMEGRSFSDILEEVRREETMRKLSAGDVTLASISSDVGYADQASLTRAFKRWMGEPPRNFRSYKTR